MIFNYLNLSLIDVVFSFSYFLVLTKYFFMDDFLSNHFRDVTLVLAKLTAYSRATMRV